MKVYLVAGEIEYSGEHAVACFASKSAAESFAQNLVNDFNDNYLGSDRYFVIELPVCADGKKPERLDKISHAD